MNDEAVFLLEKTLGLRLEAIENAKEELLIMEQEAFYYKKVIHKLKKEEGDVDDKL